MEVGASGTTNFQGTIDTDEYVTNLQGSTLFTTIDKMRWSDASVQAALLMCELPIRSAEWDVKPASEEPQDQEIAEYVKDNLFNGLTIPWDDTLRQILLMHAYGCMVFEVVYKVEDGKIGWRKWAPRLPKTITKWDVDKNGELESITQRAYKNDEYAEITIPVQKLMVFVHRKEGDNYLGTSMLRQAYKHWFFRDKYYKIDAVATERQGIGIPVITLPDGFTPDDYEDAEKMGKNLRGHEKAYIVKKTGWEIEMLDLKTQGTKNVQEMLEHHTREILKSVLAQFIDLGKGSGSYALAKEQTSVFLQSLDSSAKSVEEIINGEIQKLVDYNWTVDKYPKLTHSDLGTKDIKELADAIQSLTFAGMISSDPETEDYLRRVLKLPEKPEGSRNMQSPAQPKEKMEKPPKEEEEGKFSEYYRELTKPEMRVKFDEISDYMDNSEEEIKKAMLIILKKTKANLIPLFKSAIKSKDFAKLKNIGWKLKGQYSQIFRENIKKLFEYGKLKASYEIKKPAPITTSDINKDMSARAIYYADYHEKKLLEELKQIAATGMMDKAISNAETIANVGAEIDKFTSRNISATAALVTSDEINNGRKYTFDSFKDDIHGFQWSAILDGATCNYCMSMDGKIIGVNDKAFSIYRPGSVHFHCRCIWVAIMKEEENPPPFTGIPEGLRPQSQMPAWEFQDLEYPLPGSGKRKMPYGLGVYKEKK